MSGRRPSAARRDAGYKEGSAVDAWLAPIQGRPTTPAVADTAGPADEIAAEVRNLPQVSRLSGGVLGEVSTYLPGRRVVGVRVRDDGVTIHVVGVWGSAVDDIASAVRAAVHATLGRHVIVHVGVDDLDEARSSTVPGVPPPDACTLLRGGQ